MAACGMPLIMKCSFCLGSRPFFEQRIQLVGGLFPTNHGDVSVEATVKPLQVSGGFTRFEPSIYDAHPSQLGFDSNHRPEEPSNFDGARMENFSA